MLARSLEIQCGARRARAAAREDFQHPAWQMVITGTTQLIRAAMLNNLPRVLQLVQLGAPLDATDRRNTPFSALQWACCEGHERVAEALLDGKYEGRGANIDLLSGDWTPLMIASSAGREGVVRLLLARGARQELQESGGLTALHLSASRSVAQLLCAAPGATAVLALQDSSGRSPLARAIEYSDPACADVLRAHGAPE